MNKQDATLNQKYILNKINDCQELNYLNLLNNMLKKIESITNPGGCARKNVVKTKISCCVASRK